MQTKQTTKTVQKTKSQAAEQTAKRPGRPRKRPQQEGAARKAAPEVRVIPIGGLHEIGKNLTAVECGDDILIVDCGAIFPEDEMYGIDIVIPDFSYLLANRSKVRGILLTHGHEDHIGAIPYFLRELNVPVYGTRLTLGLVQSKLKEYAIDGNLREIKDGDKIRIGTYQIEVIHMTHSIADAVSFAITTPAGVIFFSGDFKIDYTPLDGAPIDLHKLARIGEQGVLLLCCDSTNAERKGYTPSEKNVGVTLENVFRENGKARILVATFASNVNRVQKIIDTAISCGRKVAISGRSMVNVISIAIELGYLKVPVGVLVDINKIKNYADSELVIITTGSQGEPMSALTRMADNEHKSVQIKKGDVVILSASPIPGNEKTVFNTINKLLERGAKVIYSDIAETHVSGHACQEELKLLHMLLKPEYFMPIHGEVRHLLAHAQLAESLGMREDHVFLCDNGQVMTVKPHKVEKAKEHIDCPAILVDGSGVGDVGNTVLKDRKTLSEGGLIIVSAAVDTMTGDVVSGPEILSRGFVYEKESGDLLAELTRVAENTLDRFDFRRMRDLGPVRAALKTEIQRYAKETIQREPMVLPIVQEI